jgi:hypothetical protein
LPETRIGRNLDSEVTVDTDFAAALPDETPAGTPAPAAGDRPILVTGCHRSGTGWVGQVIASSPTPIGYLWEPFSLLHRPGTLDVRWPYWFPYVCTENGPAYRDAIERTLRWEYAAAAELAAVRSPKDAARMARDWSRFRRHRRSEAIPLFKDPIAVLSSEWLAAEFDMRVVLLVRHPAAFAASIKRLHWTHPFDHFTRQPLLMRDHLQPYAEELHRFAEHEQDIVDQAILLWLVIHDVMDTYARRHPDWLVVRQEDLARRPREGFRRVLGHLGLRYDGTVDRFVEATTSAENPAESRQLDSVCRDSVSHLSNWKRRLTPAEIERVRTRTAPVADRFYSAEEW